MNRKDYHQFKKAGVVFLPSSRLEEGLISGLDIAQHFALRQENSGFLVDYPKAREKADEKIRHFQY